MKKIDYFLNGESFGAFSFIPLFPLHGLPENYVDVLNHFKHKFAISMLQRLFIFDHNIDPCSPLMILVFTWYESAVLHVYKLIGRWKVN
jgi:hypothetical protein